MKEQEYSLHNNNSFWAKFINYFKKIFYKKDYLITSSTDNNKNETNNFVNSIKTDKQVENSIFVLQQRYQRGEISEKDMTIDEVDKLLELYTKQIEELKKMNNI